MRDEQQYEQLLMQYNQLKNGAVEIRKKIEIEDFDGAMTMLKSREAMFLNCKCMRKYLELNEEEETQLNTLLDEIRELELANIKFLQTSMTEVKKELQRSQQNAKIQQAYGFEKNVKGSIINYSE